MAEALLDTSVFIDYYRGDPGAQQLVEQVALGLLTASCSSITVFELWMGSMDKDEASMHQQLLDLLEEVPFDSSIARRAAELLRVAPAADRQRLLGDAFIAATASVRGETIYTRNVRDFQSLNVAVRTY